MARSDKLNNQINYVDTKFAKYSRLDPQKGHHDRLNETNIDVTETRSIHGIGRRYRFRRDFSLDRAKSALRRDTCAKLAYILITPGAKFDT